MGNNEKKVPEVVIKRLPRYYRYLSDLSAQDVHRISSGQLSELMSVTASQIRQDFNYFGGFGQQGYGYNVDYLRDEIANILGLSDGNTMIIVGAGNLGSALANHASFEKRGFKLVGIFDSDESKVGREIRGIRIMHQAQLAEFVREHRVDIAILTIPSTAVHDTAQLLVKNGVKGLLNFSRAELDLPKDVAVEHVHLSDSLMTLGYKIKEYQK